MRFPAGRRRWLSAVGLLVVAGAVALAVFAVRAWLDGSESSREATLADVPTGPSGPLRYLDMRTPEASLQSYTRALKAHRWHDACAHQSEVVRAADDARCVAELMTYVAFVGQLRYTVRTEERRGARAEIRYNASVGYPRGIVTFEQRNGRWLIIRFRPDRG